MTSSEHERSEHERDASPAASSVPASPGAPPAGSDEQTDVDAARSVEDAIGRALSGLEKTPELPVAEHVERFEAVHSVLADALNRAESLLSGSSGAGG